MFSAILLASLKKDFRREIRSPKSFFTSLFVSIFLLLSIRLSSDISGETNSISLLSAIVISSTIISIIAGLALFVSTDSLKFRYSLIKTWYFLYSDRGAAGSLYVARIISAFLFSILIALITSTLSYFLFTPETIYQYILPTIPVCISTAAIAILMLGHPEGFLAGTSEYGKSLESTGAAGTIKTAAFGIITALPLLIGMLYIAVIASSAFIENGLLSMAGWKILGVEMLFSAMLAFAGYYLSRD
ncbi:MAG: hypothetical protein QW728_06275 [Thermoplasmata archaeon]